MREGESLNEFFTFTSLPLMIERKPKAMKNEHRWVEESSPLPLPPQQGHQNLSCMSYRPFSSPRQRTFSLAQVLDHSFLLIPILRVP